MLNKPSFNTVKNNPDRFLYENVFEDKKLNLHLRIYDKETKKSHIYDLGNSEYVAPIYSESKTETEFKSFNSGLSLKPRHFKNVFEQKKYIKEYSSMGLNLYGYSNRNHFCINEIWSEPLKCDHDFNTLWIDIETESGELFDPKQEVTIKNGNISKAITVEKLRKIDPEVSKTLSVFDEELNKTVSVFDSCYYRVPGFPKSDQVRYKTVMIQLYSTTLKQFIILGIKPWDAKYESSHGDVRYIDCKDELNMYKTFLKIVQKINPTAFNSFNGAVFDYPYIVNRMIKLGLKVQNLSPVGIVETNIKSRTIDKFDYLGVDIKGIYLLDTLELVKKYSFLNIPSFSLDSVAKEFRVQGKVSSASYTTFQGFQSGEGYIFPKEIPEDPDDLLVYNAQVKYRDEPTEENYINMKKVVYNNFVKYSIRDVEVMLNIEGVAKVMQTAKLLAYTCGCNVNDVTGTLKQWTSYVSAKTSKDNIILSLKQMNADNDIVYKAGWTSSKPGKIHKWVVSFDFASLYPSVYQAFNVGADTIVTDIPEEMKPFLEHFDYYTKENFEPGVGKLDLKYKGETNDLTEETEYFNKIKNLEIDGVKFSTLLKKYNYGVVPQGVLYDNNKQSFMSRAMEDNVKRRYAAKYEGIRLAGELEKIKAVMSERGLTCE